MEPRLVDLDPRSIEPLSLELVGKLGDVLAGAGHIEKADQARGWRRIQVIRYYCGEEAFARLVRVVISTPSGREHRYTPRGGNDEIYLERLVREGEALSIRLERGPDVAVAGLPVPFPDVDVRLEVLG